MIKMVDFHCHPDLYVDPFNVIKKAQIDQVGLVFMTNLPRLYNRYIERYGKIENVKIALGYHPQLVDEYPNELNCFLENLGKTKYIGEIGLDYSSKNTHLRQKQIKVFKKIVDECNIIGNKVLSIHSRCSEDLVLQYLKEDSCKYILHWYSGDIENLLQSMNKNKQIFVSVNSDMIGSMRGRQLIKSVPASRILLETDAPFTKDTKHEYSGKLLLKSIWEISKIRGESSEHIFNIIFENTKRILL